MKKDTFELNCPVAYTLETVGDPWSILIIRDILLGNSRFKEFERSLKISKNMLTKRLTKLIDEGVLEKVPSKDGAWAIYSLTQKGRELTPIVMELAKWGSKWSSHTL
ncbi:hypothetical protein A9Q81_14785 [Gammaproteobacteria bacterium 42_54_T18]|nr:hypothetical protein A9Q81_14785 [Gammaproteobacteria bacterium 42_54_T18]